jgi:hypothetical protein
MLFFLVFLALLVYELVVNDRWNSEVFTAMSVIAGVIASAFWR